MSVMFMINVFLMFLFILVTYWNLLKNKKKKFVEKLFVSNIHNTSLVRMVMRILTWVRTNYPIHRYHAPGMKNHRRNRRTQSTNCMGVAYAVNHFQRRKKQCIASTVTDLACSTFSFIPEQCFSICLLFVSWN